MTKHGILEMVTTNLGLNLNLGLGGSSNTDIDNTYNNNGQIPPPPQHQNQHQQQREQSRFHISSKDHFVHPMPGTYPRATYLSDGSILVAFTHFEEGGVVPARSLKVARSIDGGRTFTPHGEVTTSSGDTDNLFLMQLPWTVELPSSGGREPNQVQPILAAFRNHDYAPASTNTTEQRGYAHHRITVCQSLDNGRHWEFLSQAVESSPPYGLWEPFMRMSKLRRGEIQLFYSGELGPDDQDTFLTVSRDGGRTWDSPRAVTGRGETAMLGGGGDENGRQGTGRLRDGMVGIAETRDTRGREVLVLVLETTRAEGKFVVECLMSYDDGFSWGWRQSVYVPVHVGSLGRGRRGLRRNAGAPQVASFGDGEIAVVFMTDEDDDSAAVMQGGEGRDRWPMGAKIKVLFGARPDEGRIVWREGGRPRDVSSSGTALMETGKGGPVPSSPAPGQDISSLWPGVMTLDGDRLLVVYETGGIIKGRVITKNQN